MNNLSKMMLLLLSISLLFLSSCTDDSIKASKIINNSNASNITKIKNKFAYQSNNRVSEILEKYFLDGRIIGVLELISTEYNSLGYKKNNSGIKEFYDCVTISNFSYAGFRNSSNEPLSVNNLLVNATLMREYAKGAYSKNDPNELELFFNGVNPNKYFIEGKPNTVVPDTVVDKVVFANRVKITNIRKGQIFSKSQDIVVNWTGGSSKSIIKIEISGNDPFENKKEFCAGFYDIAENTGTHIISSEKLHLSNIGPTDRYFDITITSYEPIIKRLPNGYKICVIGVSKYVTTILLKD